MNTDNVICCQLSTSQDEYLWSRDQRRIQQCQEIDSVLDKAVICNNTEQICSNMTDKTVDKVGQFNGI